MASITNQLENVISMRLRIMEDSVSARLRILEDLVSARLRTLEDVLVQKTNNSTLILQEEIAKLRDILNNFTINKHNSVLVNNEVPAIKKEVFPSTTEKPDQYRVIHINEGGMKGMSITSNIPVSVAKIPNDVVIEEKAHEHQMDVEVEGVEEEEVEEVEEAEEEAEAEEAEEEAEVEAEAEEDADDEKEEQQQVHQMEEEQESVEEEEEALVEFTYKGRIFYKDSENDVYRLDVNGDLEERPFAKWNETSQKLQIYKNA